MAGSLYVDLPTFTTLATIPRADVQRFEADNPGFIAARSALHQAWIDARLKKRYVVPFDFDEPPTIVVMWLVALLTLDVFERRGYNPSTAEIQPMRDAATRALDEVREAADAEKGLFDLPLLADASASGVTAGGPLAYTETSPYVFTDQQAEQGSREDAAGRGSY